MHPLSFKKKNGDFFTSLKSKIDLYFNKNKIARTGNYKIYLKSIIFILAAVSTYTLIMVAPLPTWVLALLCAFLGITFSGIGFNIMHDGAHGSFSNKNWLNTLMGYSLNLMGGNVFIWKNKHNFNHHTYTNIGGVDEDIDIEPWIRTHRKQPRYWFHQYQHIYGLALYSITYIFWIFIGDFRKYFTRKIGNTSLHKMNFKEHCIFWVSKLLYVSLFFILPILQFGFWKTIIGYSIMSLTCGFILGVIFQLAHLVEETQFPVPEENSNKIEQSWVLHQIATTVNFAPANKLLFWYTGGLNFQAVHHIFPKISHIHYPQINGLIRETCDEYKVKYTEFPTFWGALRSHIAYLKQAGTATEEQ